MMSLPPTTATGSNLDGLRVALVHHWLVKMRGGEKVLEALCKMFPKADIFTLVCNPDAITDTIKSHRIQTSWLQKFPGAVRHYRHYLPLFPLAIEQFDLSAYDLVISSDASVCKGVLTNPETCHICYCHSPIRYAWSAFHTYLNLSQSVWQRKLLPFVANYLRIWDHSASSRVDYFIANSWNVARRIRKYYRRESTIVYPPIRVADYPVAPSSQRYFLVAGELIPYKRFDLAVAAFSRLGLPLWVVGDGADARKLRKLAGPTIRFLGWIPDEQFRAVLSQCRALILPGEEDFGMTVPEAHACGRPVIALGKGGALETVLPQINGLFFGDSTVESLCEAVAQFEKMESQFRPAEIRSTALLFDESRFMEQIREVISEKYHEHEQRFASNTLPTPVESCNDSSIW